MAERTFRQRQSAIQWKPPKTGAYRTPQQIAAAEAIISAFKNSPALGEVTTPYRQNEYAGIDFWDFKLDRLEKGDIPLIDVVKDFPPLSEVWVEPKLTETIDVVNELTNTLLTYQVVVDVKTNLFEMEKPSLELVEEDEWFDELLIEPEGIAPVASTPIETPLLTSSGSMGAMLEILKDPTVLQLVQTTERLPTFEQSAFIAQAARAGFPEVFLFYTLRAVHYAKGAFEFVDDFLQSLDSKLDALNFDIDETKVGNFKNADVEKAREEIKKLDDDAKRRAEKIAKELPQWARELAGAAIDDLMAKIDAPEKVEGALAAVQNTRRMLESILTIASLDINRTISLQLDKTLAEDLFKQYLKTAIVRKLLDRWIGNLTKSVPLPALHEVMISLIMKAVEKLKQDICLQFEAIAAKKVHTVNVGIRGLDTSELAKQVATLVGVLELVEEAVQAAIAYPAVFGAALSNYRDPVVQKAGTVRPKTLAKVEAQSLSIYIDPNELFKDKPLISLTMGSEEEKKEPTPPIEEMLADELALAREEAALSEQEADNNGGTTA